VLKLLGKQRDFDPIPKFDPTEAAGPSSSPPLHLAHARVHDETMKQWMKVGGEDAVGLGAQCFLDLE